MILRSLTVPILVLAGVLGMLTLAALYSSGSAPLSMIATEAVPIKPPSTPLMIPARSYDDDLIAQQWTAWAAVIGAISSVSTLIVLILTLLTTKEMLDEAKNTTEAASASVEVNREIGKKQVQAYLSVSDLDLSYVETARAPKYYVKITNTGNSPAFDIEIVFRLELVFPKLDKTSDPVASSKKYVFWTPRGLKDLQSGEATGINGLSFPFIPSTGERAPPPQKGMIALLSCYVFATNVFGDEIDAFARSTIIEPFSSDGAIFNVKHINDAARGISKLHQRRDIDEYKSKLRKRRTD